MLSPLRYVCVAALLTGVSLISSATRDSTLASSSLRYANPVFKRDCPDPAVLRRGRHNYWGYCTTTAWEPSTAHFPVLHSTDLVHWHYVGDIFSDTPNWAINDLWAPDVIYRAGMYYAYYVGLGAGSLSHCIAVATASSPKGPFHTRHVIGCGDATGRGYIDPDTYVDSRGKAYLYLSVDSPQHNISVIPLRHDLLHAAGPRRRLFGLTQKWEHGVNFSTVEGPYLIRHGSLYYLFFSGNDWNGNYAMGYATSRSPLGPFAPYPNNPILHGNKCIHGPGGGSVVEGPNGRLWMVYHAWQGPEGYANGGVRNMRIDPLVWHGKTVTITATQNGCPVTLPG